LQRLLEERAECEAMRGAAARAADQHNRQRERKNEQMQQL